jgi:type III secretory pathway component EscV
VFSGLVVRSMNHMRVAASSTVLVACALLALFTGNQLTAPQQQVVTSSSTRVVVVLIPGFPLVSIALGLLLGITAIIIRSRRA